MARGNSVGPVQLKLPMPVNTDVDLVRDTLLAAFAVHADLLAELVPSVCLEGIDGDHLVFNATGFVGSPHLAYVERSAMFFGVLKRFRQAGEQMLAPPALLLNAQCTALLTETGGST